MAKKSPLRARSEATKLPSATRTEHHRVTVQRTPHGRVLGMHASTKTTHAGTTPHFDVSYLTSLGSKGAALAKAILHNCERDYTALQVMFGNLTPQRLPFVVQITSDTTGASHSSCMGTDVAVAGRSGANVDFIRSLLVAEVDEVFMANFGKGWDVGKSPRIEHAPRSVHLCAGE